MGDVQFTPVNSNTIRAFVDRQCILWDTAHYNFEALAQVKERVLNVRGSRVKLQFNAARITSSSARIDTASLSERPCFLCAANRPSEQQAIPLPEGYEILTNPYPILPYHLTIPSLAHQPQAIGRRLGFMLQLARQLDEFVVFYNGPRCGASIPDHSHFQAGSKGVLPIEGETFFSEQDARPPVVAIYQSATLRAYPFYSRPFFEIRSSEEIATVYLFSLVYDALEAYAARQAAKTPEGESLPAGGDDEEPMMNLLVWFVKGEWVVVIFPRARHRPLCYEAPGDQNILLSPGAVDMGGLFAVPQKRDFDKITQGDMEQILSEVCFSPEQMEAVVELIKR